MKPLSFLLFFIVSIPFHTWAQYQFTPVKEIQHTPIKDQCSTGTCWSFSTISFLESEVARTSKKEVNLSEMYIVRNIYKDKAMNYMLRQGKANFSEGGLSHDVMNAVRNHGLVPQGETTVIDPKTPDHGELVSILKGMLNQLIQDNSVGKRWKKAFNAVLDVYFGIVPEKFKYQGKDLNPKAFAKTLSINADDYVSLTSFTHHPFHSEFILEIPDNYSNGSYYNLPMDELVKTVDAALEKGYTLAWDGDVSESFFSQNKGLAVFPANTKENAFKKPVKEVPFNAERRQTLFENYKTTDDHLMHIVGTAKDQNGNIYYKIKNSWGEEGPYKGYLYMSKSYFQYKTVSVMLHKEVKE